MYINLVTSLGALRLFSSFKELANEMTNFKAILRSTNSFRVGLSGLIDHRRSESLELLAMEESA